MSEQNPFFTATAEVGEELHDSRKRASKSTTIEFGKQSATKAQWRKEVATNETFRKEELERMGTKEFLKAWGGKRAATR